MHLTTDSIEALLRHFKTAAAAAKATGPQEFDDSAAPVLGPTTNQAAMKTPAAANPVWQSERKTNSTWVRVSQTQRSTQPTGMLMTTKARAETNNHPENRDLQQTARSRDRSTA